MLFGTVPHRFARVQAKNSRWEEKPSFLLTKLKNNFEDSLNEQHKRKTHTHAHTRTHTHTRARARPRARAGGEGGTSSRGLRDWVMEYKNVAGTQRQHVFKSQNECVGWYRNPQCVPYRLFRVCTRRTPTFGLQAEHILWKGTHISAPTGELGHLGDPSFPTKGQKQFCPCSHRPLEQAGLHGKPKGWNN